MEYRSILLVLALLGSAAAAAAAEEAYRWIDEEGVVHYSDRPREGAERILLPAPNVARTRRVESPRGQQPADDIADETPPGYQAIEIVSPGSEETLWNIEGVLSVSVSLTPPLQPGHRIRAYHNGVGQMVSGASFQLEEVWRGEHNLQVEVLDATGKLLIRSQPSRFYVQQNTVGF